MKRPKTEADIRHTLLRVGMIAPKHNIAEKINMLSYFSGIDGECYSKNRRYDVVLFLNVTEELFYIKRNTDVKAIVWASEPMYTFPLNYNPDLLSLADYYMGYRNFAGNRLQGVYKHNLTPVCFQNTVDTAFPKSIAENRDYNFCIFARHDPNIRKLIGEKVSNGHRSILAGPLFGNHVQNKLDTQRRCRFEFITENDVNDYYVSEKLGHALLAGCVPVYWGGGDASVLYPQELFINMRDFCNEQGVPNLDAVISHCLSPGVYDRYFSAIKKKAADVIRERFTVEVAFTQPIQSFFDELLNQKWRSTRYSSNWHKQAVLHTLKMGVSRVWIAKYVYNWFRSFCTNRT